MSDLPQQPLRTSFERLALEPFIACAERLGYQYFTGAGKQNQIPLHGKTFYQFGDLRIDLPDRYVIVEVESAGGVTNLVKYWHCIELGIIQKPVALLHLFRQVSANDYASHLELWDFLAAKMHTACGKQFNAQRFVYLQPHAMEDALTAFEQLIASGTVIS